MALTDLSASTTPSASIEVIATSQLIISASATPVLKQDVDPLRPEIEYWPPDWPVEATKGWSWNVEQTSVNDTRQPPQPRKPFTQFPGAYISTRYFGGGMSLQGWTANGSRVTVQWDEESTIIQSHHDGDLVSFNDTGDTWHNLTVTLKEGAIQIFGLRHFTPLQSFDPDIERSSETMEPIVDPLRYGNVTNEYFNVSGGGDWVTSSRYDGSERKPLIVGKPGANLTFRTWPNASFFILRSWVGRDAGEATFQIDPQPKGTDPPGKRNLSRAIEGHIALVAQPLEPSQRYTVTVVNSDPSKKLTLGSASYVLASEEGKTWDWRSEYAAINNPEHAKEAGTSSGVNVGAIVGGVIGGVVGLALLAALLWWRCHRRHGRDDNESVVDYTAMADETHTGEAHLHLPQETDAGPLNMDTVPPSYDPAWAGHGASSTPSSEPSDQATGSASRSLPPVETPLSSDNSRYIQAKREHSALFSPFARYFRSHPKRASLAKEVGKRAAAEETLEAAIEKS